MRSVTAWLAVLFGLFVLQVSVVLVTEFRHPDKAAAWLMILILLPLIGFVLYYFLAGAYKERRTIRRSQGRPMETNMRNLPRHEQSDQAHTNQEHRQLDQAHAVLSAGLIERYPRLSAYAAQLSESPITCGNTTVVYAEVQQTYRAMLHAMEQAQDHIHVAFYTIRSDRIGRIFQELWIRKARAGIKVRILYDGVGSYQLSSTYLQELQEAGVETYSFLPPVIAFFRKRMNYRNHRKILIIDGKTAFLGGVNIGAEYVGGNAKLGYWRDTHVHISGEAVASIQHLFRKDWLLASGKAIPDLPRGHLRHTLHPIERRKKSIPPEAAQMVASGPDQAKDDILEMFFMLITSAKASVFITTPYFIPDASIRMALRTAASSGVDVRIIMPQTPDSRLVHWASLSYLKEMLQAGVKCYLYQKGFIHAKVLIMDQRVATVGTANMDMRSFYSNFELNAVFYEGDSVLQLTQDFMKDLESSVWLDPVQFEDGSLLRRWHEIGARLLSPLL